MKSLKVYEIDPDVLATYNYAIIQTNKGAIRVHLFGADAPQAVCNFATLANDGFYNGLSFHRVIAGFVAQGGCPQGTGTGGPGYCIKCEVQGNPHKHKRGTLSMAHAGRDTGGSQFFLCFAPQPHLDGEHTVFGQIEDSDSLKVLDSLKQGDIMESICISKS
ncbi:peptidylprolyl isomerase [Helicobacter salomonis]|uniref:peptidylprolyl isomerase n=1 Tax=Helicobacter salomonis TaxID=56878 RepID=UPI000CF01AAE|nr:peptidylprolyl isomerase [Helicobacter salomonis]